MAMDWRHKALCRDANPELFFAVGDEKSAPAQKQIAKAKRICRRCPVSAQCLDWALETGQDDGVWGGKTAAERRTLKRQRTRT